MIKLSPSKLVMFLDCQLCFWLGERLGVERPSSPFSTLPSGMDLALKKYYDQFRGSLPAELKGKVNGVLLADKALVKRFRDWRSFFFEEPDARLYGALDDCLVDKDYFIPLDFKTRGFDLKEDSTSYYQNQLDCYALMLEKNGFKQPGYAYLVYYIPIGVKAEGRVDFKVQVEKITTHSDQAYKTFRQAVELLKGDRPGCNDKCYWCKYRKD